MSKSTLKQLEAQRNAYLEQTAEVERKIQHLKQRDDAITKLVSVMLRFNISPKDLTIAFTSAKTAIATEDANNAPQSQTDSPDVVQATTAAETTPAPTPSQTPTETPDEALKVDQKPATKKSVKVRGQPAPKKAAKTSAASTSAAAKKSSSARKVKKQPRILPDSKVPVSYKAPSRKVTEFANSGSDLGSNLTDPPGEETNPLPPAPPLD